MEKFRSRLCALFLMILWLFSQNVNAFPIFQLNLIFQAKPEDTLDLSRFLNNDLVSMS